MLGFKSVKNIAQASFDDEGFCDSAFLNFGGGGKGGGGAAAPVFTPPPAAPAVSEAATIVDANTPAAEAKRKKDAITSGAKSLQIPMLTPGVGGSSVGTGVAPK